MNIKYTLVLLLAVTTLLSTVHGFAYVVAAAATAIIGGIIKVADKAELWVVEVHNNGKHRAHLWCASKDDRIGSKKGVWVKPGDKIAWAFRRRRSTQFWCTLDWHGQRVGWDVYVKNWKDAPNPTKWSIRNDGVYDQWKNRKWRKLRS